MAQIASVDEFTYVHSRSRKVYKHDTYSFMNYPLIIVVPVYKIQSSTITSKIHQGSHRCCQYKRQAFGTCDNRYHRISTSHDTFNIFYQLTTDWDNNCVAKKLKKLNPKVSTFSPTEYICVRPPDDIRNGFFLLVFCTKETRSNAQKYVYYCTEADAKTCDLPVIDMMPNFCGFETTKQIKVELSMCDIVPETIPVLPVDLEDITYRHEQRADIPMPDIIEILHKSETPHSEIGSAIEIDTPARQTTTSTTDDVCIVGTDQTRLFDKLSDKIQEEKILNSNYQTFRDTLASTFETHGKDITHMSTYLLRDEYLQLMNITKYLKSLIHCKVEIAQLHNSLAPT